MTYAQFRRGAAQDGIYGPDSRQKFQWNVYNANGSPNGKCVNTN